MIEDVALNYSSNLQLFIDLGINFLILIVLDILISKIAKKSPFIWFFTAVYILNTILDLVKFTIASQIVTLVLFSMLTCFFIAYSPSLRSILTKFTKKEKLSKLDANEKEKFYNTIEEAILDLSSTKTGALLTFEKGENLDEYINKGKIIESKVSADLIRTIFYVGTPLHDGAIIIRGNIIEAASVFYTPATKAMPGKFGARHRAAIGFSETHSSITIVVSEETGRISFATHGDLIPATHENFKKRLKELLEK